MNPARSERQSNGWRSQKNPSAEIDSKTLTLRMMTPL